MANINNAKIERKKGEIAKTETKIAEYREKLRAQKQELTDLENEEIIALYRREKFNEDEFAALLRSQRKETDADDSESEIKINKEEQADEDLEN